MTTPLFDPPPAHSLPVSWHGDLYVDFVNADPDDPSGETLEDYAPGVRCYLDIRVKKATATAPEQVRRIEAVIDGPHGVCRLESEEADLLKDGMLWVYLISEPGSPTLETPVVNGVIERRDGDE